jgi:putative Mg2+ transporter-C (MgtC) family protein
MVAIVGVAVGFGYYVLSLAVTLLTLIVLTLLNMTERRKKPRHPDDDRPAAESGPKP